MRFASALLITSGLFAQTASLTVEEPPRTLLPQVSSQPAASPATLSIEEAISGALDRNLDLLAERYNL